MKDKRVVVVGASSGLGASFALEAGSKGAKVALIARRQPLLEEVAHTISARGGGALVLPCDLTIPSQIEAAFDRIRSEWKGIDLSLNAAGVVGPLRAVVDTEAREIRHAVEINVLGLFLCCREELRVAMDQKSSATIINVTSGAAGKAYHNWSAYSSSKAAVDSITRIAAAEHETQLVRVFAVSPGPFESQMQETMRATSEEEFPARGKFVKLHAERKLPSADQVAEATLELARSYWPELSGRIIELRDVSFRHECRERGIVIEY